MDLNDLLKIVYILLGLTLIGVGFYLLIVLRQVQENLTRTKNILDRADTTLAFLENNILKPAAAIMGYASVAREVLGIAGSFKEFFKGKSKKEGRNK